MVYNHLIILKLNIFLCQVPVDEFEAQKCNLQNNLYIAIIKNLNFSLINCFPISKADASEEKFLIGSYFCKKSNRASHIIFRIIHRFFKTNAEIWRVFKAFRKFSFTVNSLSVFKVFYWDSVLFYFSFTVEKVKFSEGIPSVILIFSFFLFTRREKFVSLFV